MPSSKTTATSSSSWASTTVKSFLFLRRHHAVAVSLIGGGGVLPPPLQLPIITNIIIVIKNNTTMKKLLFTLFLTGMSVLSFAQFKIYQNGNMSLKGSATTALSPLSLNSNGNADYFVYYSGNKNGLNCITVNANVSEETVTAGNFFCSGTNKLQCGIKALSAKTNSTTDALCAIGVKGSASNTGQGYSFGVAGMLGGSKNGAGVFGSTTTMSYMDDRYAGYFVGKTKVSGNLIVTGSIQGTLLSGSPSKMCPVIQDVSCSEDKESITEQLLKLGVLLYYNPQEEKIVEKYNSSSTNEYTYESNPEIKSILEEMGELPLPSEGERLLEKQIERNKHYAIDVDLLESIFPNMVYTDTDGSKKINYIEMIPLLVQSIKELSNRIDEMKVTNSREEFPSSRTQNIYSRLLPNNILYQNTPNPFTAQTEIRFSLSEGAQNAYIYIFDMTGKTLKQIPVTPEQESVTIQGYELNSGIYLYSLVVNGQEIDTKRMILSK